MSDDWYADYYNTYVQKDVRGLLEVQNLSTFDAFLRLCAGRSGQLLNLSSLATACGISQPTAARWLSVLEASYLVFRLAPHHRNFNKRVTKTHKLYFFDTGLLCHLLRISDPQQLESYPLRGAIFETWVVAELVKHYRARALDPPLFFWRDQHGHEVDLLIDQGIHLAPVEIKSGMTFQDNWLRGLKWFGSLQGSADGTIIYGGLSSFTYKKFDIRAWDNLASLLASQR